MSPRAKASDAPPPAYLRIPARRILAVAPIMRFCLGPGDRALVAPGQPIEAGTPIAERTLDVEMTDVGKLGGGSSSSGVASPATRAPAPSASVPEPLWKSSSEPVLLNAPPAPRPAPEEAPEEPQDRRNPPIPGKWWVGGDERRGKAAGRRDAKMRVGGTLLFELDGRWRAAAGERQQTVLAPTSGVVVESRNGIAVTIEAAGVAIAGVLAGGTPSRGRLDVRLVDGELRDSMLDISKAGTIVVAGGRISAEALTRARAMNVRGMIAGSLGSGELRDLAASDARQRAGLHDVPPFGVLALDGYQMRPIASPILNLLMALSGREAAIITDPPLLVLDAMDVPLPQLPSDWVRVRSGPHAGREGRWVGSAGLHRFKAGIHLEAANVRLGDEKDTTIVALADLERFVF